MSQAKLCFIGAGFHASTNIFPSAVEAGAEIVAVSTRSLDRSQAALTRFGSSGTPYDDYKQMLQKEKCDGVVVVAQPGDQTQIVMDCIKAGKHVFVDKPLGWTAEEAAAIAEAAEETGIVLMVGFMKRYAPVYMKLKELIESDELGAARSFQIRFACDSTGFSKTEEQFLKLAAIHLVDLMRGLFGEVAQVAGFNNNLGENISQSFSLKFENGISGSVYFAGMTAWSSESESVLVTFDNGHVAAEDSKKLSIHKSPLPGSSSFQTLSEETKVLTPPASTMSGCLGDLYARGFIGEMAHFIACSKQKLTPNSSGRDNIGTMDLCDRLLDALN
ncbi:Gfo/Idh/MocA family oxidoreductase [Paenibacillus sp. FSL H8-0537]|uniref:Gfo/Idh/MocA family protein n=1 Tax=Paenibacillus sp. FSL H8-0537 TaxID=2921399 RepID=UPI00310148D5